MEKQRIKRLIKSGRRFLIILATLFCSAFWTAPAALSAHSQILTLEQIKKLRFVPEEGQNLYTKTDLKFTVTIPDVRASQVQVLR